MTDYTQQFYAERPEYLVEPEGDEKRWVEQGFADMLWLLRDAPGRRLVDFGAGKGHFARVAMEAGWEVEGVDPSREAVEAMSKKGIRCWENMAEVFGEWAPLQNDAVTMFQLLEHVADPGAVIRSARDALVPGGMLLVSVPRDNSFLQGACVEYFGTDRWWIDPVHEHYFSSPHLRSLLGLHGFQVLEETTTFPMELFVLLGADYTRDPDEGKLCHERRRNLDLRVDAGWRQEFYKRLASAGMGRHIIMLARKT